MYSNNVNVSTDCNSDQQKVGGNMLGKKVKDRITGYTGVATSRVEYLNGCIQYGVKGKIGKDGKQPDVEYIDEEYLSVVNTGVKVKAKQTGGLQVDRPRR